MLIGNTFRNLIKPRDYYFRTMSMMAASAENCCDDIEGYGRAKNILIANNRFEQNDTRIAAGTYPRPNYPLLPQNIRVRNNVFVGAAAQSAFDFVAPGTSANELREEGNLFQ